MLSPADKALIAFGLLDFYRSYPATDDEPFSTWLKRTNQTDRAIRHFWEPIIVGTLNDTFDRCSTRYAGQVFHESFLKSAAGGRLGIPSQPLSDFYANIAHLAAQQGTTLHPRTSIDRHRPPPRRPLASHRLRRQPSRSAQPAPRPTLRADRPPPRRAP